MNIGQIKIVSWTAAALLTAGLAAYVWSFASTIEERRAEPNRDHVRKVLSVEAAPIKSDGQVPYEVVKRVFHDLNWTGAVKVVADPTPVTPVDLKPEVVAVKELVRVLSVVVDYGDAKQSSVILRYKPKAQVAAKGLGGAALLREGDTLARPHEGIRVHAISADGVTFAFADEARERETLAPLEFDLLAPIVKVGPDGIVEPLRESGIVRRSGPAYVPGKTTRLGRDRFVLGTEDLQAASDSYLDILSNDVKLRQHRNPRTGRYDGVEITDVTPGSFAERHGAQQGDVVKSINGHAVNSTSEAINFVKMNKDRYSTWEVVIENKGKTRTVTYESPQS
ncbi:MAG: PDZ domain-containing protein [Planctomycetes bacterium]|nr:PDZ domain-containing protein [Planctomycetota bacterium]